MEDVGCEKHGPLEVTGFLVVAFHTHREKINMCVYKSP